MQRTVNYDLCQYEGSDKTSYLINYNGDMLKIDTAIKGAKDAADNAQSKANTADGKADANAASISTLDTQINGAGGVAADVSSLQGSVNTINSLIGNGEPTTQDKTIIGAINEIAAEIPSGEIAADHVTYDGTTSGLAADDVQAAIDEVVGMLPQGGVDADDVDYDNTQSGLSATNVQAAIDELAQGSGSAPKLVFDDTITTSGTTYNFTDTVDYAHKNLLVICTREADTSNLQRGAGVVYTSLGITAGYISIVSSATASGLVSVDNITGTTFTAYTQTNTAVDHIKIYEI